MANLNFQEPHTNPFHVKLSRRKLFRAGLGLGLSFSTAALIGPFTPSARAQIQAEDFSFVQKPVIVGDKIIGAGRIGDRLSVLEGTPGEGNTFYFTEEGIINDENIHVLAISPKNRNRLVLLGDSGFYYSDNGWQSHANFGSPAASPEQIGSLRFSSDGEFAFMDLEREGQRNTVVFDPDSIPNFAVLEGNYLAQVSSQPSTPRLQPDGTYADYRMEKIGDGWRLRKHTYDLRLGQERDENTILGFRFNEGLVQILGDHMTARGSLRLGLIGSWNLTNDPRNDAGRVGIASFYEVNPASGEILYSSSPEPGLYPLSSDAPESILSINGKAEDPINGDYYFSIFYSGLDGNGDHTQGYGIELSTNSSLQFHGRIRWPETDIIDYLGILAKSEEEQYLVALTNGELRSLRMGSTEQNQWKQALLQN